MFTGATRSYQGDQANLWKDKVGWWGFNQMSLKLSSTQPSQLVYDQIQLTCPST